MIALLLALAARPAQAEPAPAPVEPGLEVPELDERARARVLRHRLPERPPPDPTNRVADDERAAELGRALFFDPRLSRDGSLSCASCHEPERAFTDGRAVAVGLGTTTRNAPSLPYAALQRWLFWDGRADSLWAQAAQPFESELEMGGDRVALARLIAGDAGYRAGYEALFGPLPEPGALPERAKPLPERPDDPRASAWSALDAGRREAATRVLANAGKALAAYERGLPAGSSPFDRFARALAEGDPLGLAALDASERRGLALFEGRAGCWQCHSGPAFSDGEFHDVGFPVPGGGPPRDPGRHAGLAALAADPFNAAGRFSDAPEGERAAELAALVRDGESWGQFRTPTLRNVELTAPYGHAGQLATLEEVVEFYSTLEGASFASHHGERVLRPLALSAEERADLVAFLRALTDARADPRWRAPD